MRVKLKIVVLSLVLCLVGIASGFAQTINLAIPSDPDSFDPKTTVAAATSEIAFNIYEGLVKAKPDGTVEGALAKSWEISEANTLYTFELREAYFHNGNEVTVEDIIFSLNTARDEKQAVRAGELAMIESIEGEGAELRIKLKESHGAFLYALTEVYAAIYPKEASNLNNKPIGTGPYFLKEWLPNQVVRLERFDNHWGAEKPHYKKANFLIIPDENSMVLNLKAGRVDFIPRLEVSVLHQVEGDRKLKVISLPMNVVQVLAINNQRPPFDDLKVRRALALAVNTEEVILGAAWGLGTPLNSGISPAMESYFNKDLATVNPYNPNLAKQLLKEAGQENLKLSLILPANYPLHIQTGEIVAQMWKAVGINVDLKIMEWGTWLERVYTQRDYEVSIIGLAGRLDPHGILVRYTSDNSRNFFNFKNEEYDGLIQKGLQVVGKEREAVYLQAQEILAHELPGVFIMDPPELAVMKKQIQGFQAYPTYVVDLSKLFE